MRPNVDELTVEDFGAEWSRFDQSQLDEAELLRSFYAYFRLFPWDDLPPRAVGFDAGCGSGRWAKIVAARVGELHCVDASAQALQVARLNLSGHENAHFHHSTINQMPLPEESMDFGYSIGVLHHVPDTRSALAACVKKLRRGAPFLCYLSYRIYNRPGWYRALWRVSDAARHAVARLPHTAKHGVAEAIAACVYLPLARSAALLERCGGNTRHFPLASYRHASFYTMRTDALDRFGTRCEQRFTVEEVRTMMQMAGLERIQIGSEVPYWCAIGYRA
jgi:SAM-dependent methyltransferase